MHRQRYTRSENDTLLQVHQRAQYSLYAHAAAYLATGLSGTGLNAPCRPSMQAIWMLQEPGAVAAWSNQCGVASYVTEGLFRRARDLVSTDWSMQLLRVHRIAS